ncbi:MAG: helix-turn-helix domain-containing protein [Verrucomicrobiota bacterium]
MKNGAKNKHIGSDFDDFLRAEGMLEEIEAAALKKIVAWQLEEALRKTSVTKTEMAKRMKTSRAAVDRLLDATNPSVTLITLQKAARALGRKLKIELVAA